MAGEDEVLRLFVTVAGTTATTAAEILKMLFAAVVERRRYGGPGITKKAVDGVSTAFSIITTALLRMAEIYLRAAISPLALSLLLDDRTRQAGMLYVKRYLALILQAAIIVIALALGPLFFSVGTTILSGLPVDDGFIIGGVLKTIIPTLCAIVIINQIVTRSEQISNSMFGLM